jgi:hypothetical protein
MKRLDRDLQEARIRSPRSAAFAGIIFSLLTAASMAIMTRVATISPAGVNEAWLETTSQSVRLAVALVPFAGIAFLWFTGVIRDLLGNREDQFFSTVFFGSGIIFVATLFVWATIAGAIYGTFAATAERFVDALIYIFGLELMNEIMSNFTLRMAGVYMLSIGTLWLRTKTLPRWFIILTYIVALSFLFFAGLVRTMRFVFPGWVFAVSVYVLVATRRLDNESG